MSLASSGITVSAVKSVLGSSNNNVGGLCKSTNINYWSAWKPISCNAVTLTRALLKSNNYGITMKYATTAAGLLTAVKDNSNVGFVYNRPTGVSTSPYRLGDFRNYNHNAFNPMEAHFEDGDNVPINGVSSSYIVQLDGIQPVEPDNLDNSDYLTMKHLLPATDNNGNAYTWTKGAYITDGTYSYWSVGHIPWGNTNWQRFKGKTVTVLEFMTNIADGKTSQTYTTNQSDRFYAIPYPLHSINVTNTSPSGSKTVWVDGLFEYPIVGSFGSVSYDFVFSAVGDVYAGGTITNVHIGLYRDSNCTDVIIQKKLADSITISSEGTSSRYNNLLTNSTNQMCYVGIHWNNQLQYKIMPMQQLGEQ